MGDPTFYLFLVSRNSNSVFTLMPSLMNHCAFRKPKRPWWIKLVSFVLTHQSLPQWTRTKDLIQKRLGKKQTNIFNIISATFRHVSTFYISYLIKKSEAVMKYLWYEQCAGPQKQEVINGHIGNIFWQKNN